MSPYDPDLDAHNEATPYRKQRLAQLVRENGGNGGSDKDIEERYDFSAILAEVGVHFCLNGHGLQVDLDVNLPDLIARSHRPATDPWA